MSTDWKAYFHFTKKERIGVIALVVLILVAILLPHFFVASFSKPDKALAARIQAELAKIQNPGADSRRTVRASYEDDRYVRRYERLPGKSAASPFIFDPNTLSPEGWRKLGVRQRVIQTIQKYLASGAQFRKAEDLFKIFGLKKGEVEKLIPYVRIQLPDKKQLQLRKAFDKKSPARAIIDINLADSALFESLPGIGAKLARRIILFREKLGGFHSVDQVSETYGLPDSTFQKVQARLQCASAAIRKISINTADEKMLSRHPYIGRKLAGIIVRYRKQHGAYQKLEDLKQIAIMTPEIFDKVVHYLVAD